MKKIQTISVSRMSLFEEQVTEEAGRKKPSIGYHCDLGGNGLMEYTFY